MDQLAKPSFINLTNICQLFIDPCVFIFRDVNYAKEKRYWCLPIAVCRQGRK